MYKGKKILAIIPARGGSKGLINKNIKKLIDKPLIGWTIEHSKNSKFIDEIFVTTDSENIANVASLFGVNIPFLRPEELANDSASTVDVVLHVISYFESKNLTFDYIVLLEPTSPLRKKNDIDNAIQILLDHESCDGLVSLGEVHMEHPLIVKKINTKGKIASYIDNSVIISQRQQADKAFFPYGVIYMIKTNILKCKKSFYTDNIMPFFIERWQNYEVDDIYDFLAIETILKYKLED